PFEDKPVPKPEARVLSDLEVHLLFLDFRQWTKNNLDAVRHDLAAAKLDAPDSPEVAEWSALLAEYEDREDEAEVELRRAVARAPDNEGLRFRLAALHYRQAEETGAPVTVLEPEVRALTPLARRPTTLNQIAWVHALANHP